MNAHTRPTLEIPKRRDLDRRATELRTEVASAIADDYLLGFNATEAAKRVSESVYASTVAAFPADNPTLVLSFNLAVTEMAVERCLSDTSLGVAESCFLAARSVELGASCVYDPRTPRLAKTHLAAAKNAGYFFTPPSIATMMSERAIGARTHIRHALDPAAGAGSLLVALMLVATSRDLQLDAVTAVERDAFTARLCRRILAHARTELRLESEITVVEADAIDALFNGSRVVSASDCIVMNPPYGRVKFLRSFLTNKETETETTRSSHDEQAEVLRAESLEKGARYREISRALGLGGGTQDYQRLFIGLALRVLTEDGRMAVIAPNSWMGDRQSTELRSKLICGRLIREVHVFPEGLGLFPTVNQATAVAVFAKSNEDHHFEVRTCVDDRGASSSDYLLSYESIDRLDPGHWRIPLLNADEHHIYEHLSVQQRVRDVAEIHNFRGELDLTLQAASVVDCPSPYRLIRGDNIERYALRPSGLSQSFVEPNFVESLGENRRAHIAGTRIACRQVSYLAKKRRLSFVLVPPDSVLGNSCNYLVLANSTEDSHYSLLAQMNSVVLEWYFRVFNSNNHVANYEIDDFPVLPAGHTLTPELGYAGKMLSSAYREGRVPSKLGSPIEDYCDSLVAFAFGLSAAELHTIATQIAPDRAERLAAMLDLLHRHGIPKTSLTGAGWYGHTPPTMSAHDLDVARHVPQGGNWEDIPESVPSKRLDQIREMTRVRGRVRTSYYGRLRPDQPAYTISTYFNRPGNGTNITPWEDRVLTSREAARLQAFPDWYWFLGNETSIRNQIGNAVPPLLGYAVGRSLRDQHDSETCVDLFCGAGGLSLGLAMAGWKSVASVDNDASALATLAFNRPSEEAVSQDLRRTLVLKADLSKKSERERVVASVKEKLDGRPLGLIAGGPPCQGFSHAGWRLDDDDRNDLAAVFMELVDELQPQKVLLENVEGLLSYKKGAVLAELLQTLRELGYAVGDSPWRLSAECFGVPQMRRRVFLVGSRTEHVPTAPIPAFQRCRGRREGSSPSDLELGRLPYPVTAGEALIDLERLGATTHSELGSRPLRRAYEMWVKGLVSVDEMIESLSSADPNGGS